MIEKERIQTKLDQNEKDIEQLNVERRLLLGMLAKAEKPEYKHGDLFYGNRGPKIAINSGGAVRVCGTWGVGSGSPSECRSAEAPVGNIFRLLRKAGPDGRIIALSKKQIVSLGEFGNLRKNVNDWILEDE